MRFLTREQKTAVFWNVIVPQFVRNRETLARRPRRIPVVQITKNQPNATPIYKHSVKGFFAVTLVNKFYPFCHANARGANTPCEDVLVSDVLCQFDNFIFARRLQINLYLPCCGFLSALLTLFSILARVSSASSFPFLAAIASSSFFMTDIDSLNFTKLISLVGSSSAFSRSLNAALICAGVALTRGGESALRFFPTATHCVPKEFLPQAVADLDRSILPQAVAEFSHPNSRWTPGSFCLFVSRDRDHSFTPG